MTVHPETARELQEIFRTQYCRNFYDLAVAFGAARDTSRERDDEAGEQICQWELEGFGLVSRPQIIRHGSPETLVHKFSLEDGTIWPDVRAFSKEQYEYYHQRGIEEQNRLLKVRYLDIGYEHGFRPLGLSRYSFAKDLVPALLWLHDRHMAGDDDEPNYIEALWALDRAAVVSLSMRASNLLVLVRDKIEQFVGILRQAASLRWSLEASELVRAIREGPLPDAIPEFMEDMLLYTLQQAKQQALDDHNDLLYRELCHELIQWARIRDEDSTALNLDIGASFEFEAEYQSGREQKSALIRAHYLEQALQHYINTEVAPERLAGLKVAIRQAYDDAVHLGEFKQVSTAIDIDADGIEEKIRLYIDGLSPKEVLAKIAADRSLFPDVGVVRGRAEEIAKNHPLLSIFPSSTVGGGRKIAQSDDEVSKKRFQFAEQYKFSLRIMGQTVLVPLFAKLKEAGMTSEDVMERLEAWPELDPERVQLIRVGIERHFADDHVSAIHVLIPQLEAMLRHLFMRAGYAVTVIRKGTTQQEETLNEFLDRDDVRKQLRDDYHTYLKFVLVDQLGLNLRNTMAHGLLSFEGYNEWTSLLVIHQMLLLTAYTLPE